MYRDGITLRFYSPTTNKKFFAGYGGADKISMYQAFNKWQGLKPNISNLPAVTKGDGVPPTSDIIDAFALCEFGRQELRLRRGIDVAANLPQHVQEVFALKKEKSLKRIAKKIEKGTASREERKILKERGVNLKDRNAVREGLLQLEKEEAERKAKKEAKVKNKKK